MERHGYRLGYTAARLSLQAAGLVAKARRRVGVHRKKRPRRPLPGMMLFQDGSTHRWLPGLGHDLDLVVTLDDATSVITSALPVSEEGTASSFLGLGETIAGYGLFGSLYTDRGSRYFHTPEAGGKVSRTQLTQVGRALAQLGIRHIASYSPEGGGRMGRAFGTLQGRPVPKFRRARIVTVAAANAWLRTVFVPDWNRRFGRPATEEGTAFVAYGGLPLETVLCVQEDRQVGRDNCVARHGRSLQIPAQRHRHHDVRATVRVHEQPDGSPAVVDGPRCLARDDAGGALLGEDAGPRRAA